jgi:hypothetical protein
MWNTDSAIIHITHDGKVIPVLNLIKHYSINTYGGVDV